MARELINVEFRRGSADGLGINNRSPVGRDTCSNLAGRRARAKRAPNPSEHKTTIDWGPDLTSLLEPS
eukprot:9207541-Pyramimonas_sp.AAC.1